MEGNRLVVGKWRPAGTCEGRAALVLARPGGPEESSGYSGSLSQGETSAVWLLPGEARATDLPDKLSLSLLSPEFEVVEWIACH